ncbi:MAG: hybrid sensor histidine kinase/response regulator [Leptolyngbyaceae cyanobacterium MO_188.B28]|nr:hybrid sensor histidine kinase/response regulator [Leptolyngbyaceae cyanobacterium MO_188.B28]
MDKDQQARLNFLEESGKYFDQIEQVLLDLPTAENYAQQLDIAMRAAHSLKGGAGMMGFMTMAQVAHSLEDFLKILRARRIQVDTELETLLLQGLDCLKEVHRQQAENQQVDQSWMVAQAEPVFGRLRDRLGDLSEADEDRLLSEEEDIDEAILVFNSGVESSLDQFESVWMSLQGEALRQALSDQADRLSDFGLMGELDAFVNLCQSVRMQAETVSLNQLPALADQSLALWRRSQSLVQLGRTEKLPHQLDFIPAPVSDSAAIPSDTLNLEPLPSELLEPLAIEDAIEDVRLGDEELATLQAELAQAMGLEEELSEPVASENLDQSLVETPQLIQQPETEGAPPPISSPATPAQLEIDQAQLEDAVRELEALAAEAIDETLAAPDTIDLADLCELQTAFAQIDGGEVLLTPEEAADAESVVSSPANGSEAYEQTIRSAPFANSSSQPSLSQSVGLRHRSGAVRVAAAELQQINLLFGELILERNAINLRQRQLDDFVALLQERMQSLEVFNQRLRQWYDRASMENLAPSMPPANGSANGLANGSAFSIAQTLASATRQNMSLAQDFDALEMDQYSDLHLMAQEQMETIVKLQEVTADIRLGLQDMGQAAQSLNTTTRKLQSRITRAQMRPFSDIVGRFPRVIRDLSVQYGKKVKLKMAGETTLFERATLDLLADPINQLLRNSFDHGIEFETERQALGKSPEGVITLRAFQQGNQALIVISDDGRGISLDRIRDRLRQHDISDEHIARMSEQELLALIFDPGFSTADQVTELSGRGVGMDIVRANLNQLNGDIQVETNLGQGSTFTINIPLSLSVLRIMLLEQQGMIFAIPVDAVEELCPLSPEAIIASDNGSQFCWQGQSISLTPLEQHLAFHSSVALTPLDGVPVINHSMVVIVSHGQGFYAIPIQRFWGEQEVAARPVSSPMPLPQGFTGATVLGDGRIVPLVDLSQLVAGAAAVTQPSIEPTQFSSAGQPSDPTPSSLQQTILVVDDSVHLRRYLTATLEKEGYFVEQARDGQEAVDMLLGGLRVQAVLCDVEMPRLDGYGVLDEIKGRSEFKSLPILMITSRSSEKHRKLAMNLGASAYFAKPYNDQQLLKTLANLITASLG